MAGRLQFIVFISGLVSYSMPQGDVRGGVYNFTDAIYDGILNNRILSFGLGMLTDGRLALSDYVDTNGFGWIGWRKNYTPEPYIIFEFLETRIFHSVTFHCNVRDRTRIKLFSKVTVSFNVDGISYDASLSYEPENVSSGHVWMNHNVTVDLCQHIGKFVKLNFTYRGDWILISEVTFSSGGCHICLFVHSVTFKRLLAIRMRLTVYIHVTNNSPSLDYSHLDNQTTHILGLG